MTPLRLIEQFSGGYLELLEPSAPLSDCATWERAGGGLFELLPIRSGESLALDSARCLRGPLAGRVGFLAALDTWWQLAC